MAVASTPLITVIVPIYNVENYLKKCLNSIINQQYKKLEILLIDDGSTDLSGKIADEYAVKDNRIKVVHKENGGLSDARNYGLKIMTGEYVTFIDSDDYVTEDYVSYMYGLLEKTNFKASLALCSLINVYSSTDRLQDNGNQTEVVLSGKKCIEMMCYHDLVDTCAYAKLGKRELYTNDFFPKGKLFEDIGSTYKLFLQCDKVACGFKGKYYYVIRPNSIVTSGFSSKKLELLAMTDQMAQAVVTTYPDLQKAVLRRQVYARFSTLNQTLHSENARQDQQMLINYIRKNKKAVLQDSKAPRRDKLAYRLLQLGLPFYRFAWLTYEKRKGE
ncbi:glycosyltransferase family 2 protein [Lactobacillus taiwanensis]|uniref:glycosyltransferase family 2 protein n=1 Tax=Lactobacillus taiwanensis TaxID=508451 RepID=UPI00272DB7EC|nr:glycosyltransferase family 2 protein [Lactobacillus taiwanensis]